MSFKTHIYIKPNTLLLCQECYDALRKVDEEEHKPAILSKMILGEVIITNEICCECPCHKGETQNERHKNRVP